MDEPSQAPEHELFLFLASTAHDMKNSISVLSGTLERLLVDASPATESDYPELAQMLYQTKRLNDNLMQLLALYKQVGKPDYPFDLQPVELGQLVDQVAAIGAACCSSRAASASSSTSTRTDLASRRRPGRRRALACDQQRHPLHLRHVRLAIREFDGWLELRVEDNGPGYPPALLKAGASATREVAGGIDFMTNSAGLGLYFSSEVAKMHRHRGRTARCAWKTAGRGGGCFILRLP
jgi:two-component system sensor histidine kinase SenX3